ncbi:hypothetical protein [Mycobacteroides immunogenum]|uniref:Serine hydrolase n=1 Tax=Mycobacteroides immunogenum TaxID=83262 RepID=A0ABR5LJS3_9MYCO|nr:hypothetical protein [Mycobacteroides immunogenum]AMT69857.1 hypothetical protein ABG82_05410 [Mycobacteroides immunogenum]ANO02906.1 hypothetical protein BAB75_05430 [Mycobacteroides immunogenum]KIU39326.1 hypothetical protein TL11_17880 [Mycobacteroides immunogenum]KPG03173.1 hypothetical protein AN910_26620 [Mycobacteroides immunogenum]KPG05384.1 hypothetical protein AN909_20395 [Mycobacteroides immunogenum]
MSTRACPPSGADVRAEKDLVAEIVAGGETPPAGTNIAVVARDGDAFRVKGFWNTLLFGGTQPNAI